VAAKTKFADAFDVLVCNRKRRAKERISRRNRHETALPGEKWIGVPVLRVGMAHATLLDLREFNPSFFRLHPR
jgi:hypothetical protein